MARRLRLARRDAELAADEVIEQRRLADVRPADQRDIAATLLLISVHRSSDFQPIERGARRDLFRFAATAAASVRHDAETVDTTLDGELRQMFVAGSRRHPIFRRRQPPRLHALLQLRLAVARHLRVDFLDVAREQRSDHAARRIVPCRRPAPRRSALRAYRRESIRGGGRRSCVRLPPTADIRRGRFHERRSRAKASSRGSRASASTSARSRRETSPQPLRDHETERRVAEKFESFVVGVAGAAVRQRETQQVLVCEAMSEASFELFARVHGICVVGSSRRCGAVTGSRSAY